MTLRNYLRTRVSLPVICAPMFLVSGPELVAAACKAGIAAGLPRANARSREQFAQWLTWIKGDLDAFREQYPARRVGPLMVNLPRGFSSDELAAEIALCAEYDVKVFISAQGNPAELTRKVHEHDGYVIHDVTTFKHANKAIDAGVDGLTCIGAGGGGHSGTVSHLALTPKIRQMFDGVIVMAGAVTDGRSIRAAEVLGADFAYMGTRFIASEESMAPTAYKQHLINDSLTDLWYTGAIAGVPANWMRNSIIAAGLNPDTMAHSPSHGDYSHLPTEVRPWRDIWSAGQGIELINDVPPVEELVARLRSEYLDACRTPDMTEAAASAGLANIVHPPSMHL